MTFAARHGVAFLVMAALVLFVSGQEQTEKLQTACPSECLYGLCQTSLRSDAKGAVEKLFPNLFRTAAQLGLGGCKMTRGSTEYQATCASSSESLLAPKTGCKGWWHQSDRDRCCETCSYWYIPWTQLTGMQGHPVQLPWYGLFQAWNIGYCGLKGDCKTKCTVVYRYYPMLVTQTPISNIWEFFQAQPHFEYVKLPSHCKCF